jgi:hypothetical protein
MSDVGEFFYVYNPDGSFKERLWLDSKSGFVDYAKKHNLSVHDYGQGPKIKALFKKKGKNTVPVLIISKIILGPNGQPSETQALLK